MLSQFHSSLNLTEHIIHKIGESKNTFYSSNPKQIVSQHFFKEAFNIVRKQVGSQLL